MPAKPEKHWKQLGWKVWCFDGADISVYSSKTHKWRDVPNCVQKMYRYYTNGKKSWREMIGGADFYLESDADKSLLPRTKGAFKIGYLDDGHFHDAIDLMRADSVYPVDNSIDRYVDESKELIGWTIWVVVNDELVRFSSATHTWNDVPDYGAQLMNKYWRAGEYSWIEHVTSQDIYYIDSAEQGRIREKHSFLKNGSVISEAKLSEIHALALADDEAFSS